MMSVLRFRVSRFPIALFILCLLSFGLLIPWLGFFWDDWPSIWYLHEFGSSIFIDVFSIDRPLLGWLFVVTTSILGESVYTWQLFGIAARWLCCISLWWTLKALWPRLSLQSIWVTLLFAVYPGFTQQYISVTYSHIWIIQSAFFFSLGTMIHAIKRSRWLLPLLALSWALSTYVIFSTEYFFGLELIRPVILWWLLTDRYKDISKRFRKLALLWLPYVFTFATFLYWRILLHPTPRGNININGLLINPLAYLYDLGETILQDIFRTSFQAWGQVVNFVKIFSYDHVTSLLFILASGLVTALMILYLSRLQPQSDTNNKTEPDEKNKWQMISLGIIALATGGIPYWITNLPIRLQFSTDRFTLPMILGASLLLVGLLELLVKKHKVKIIILGIAIGLAVGTHVQTGNLYRKEWNSQKSFLWQLVWRVPAIKPGTLILTSELPLTYFSDNSLTAPINWIYAKDTVSENMPYLLYDLESRLGVDVQSFEADHKISEPYRATSFEGSTSQAVVITYSAPGCVRVIDPIVDASLPRKPKYISDITHLSKVDLIEYDSDSNPHPPQSIFGPEPEHDWCYYYEKADLARQSGDWENVVKLGEEVFSRDYQLYAVNAPELIVYIEGYAYAGKWEKAVDLSEEALSLQHRMKSMLCSTWVRIDENTLPDPDKEAALTKINNQSKCEIQ